MSITFYTFVINYLDFFSENDIMNGMTVNEIGVALGITGKAAKMRLRTKGIKPIGYAGPTAMYDPSCVEAIREVSKGGRPRKDSK
jgi:hypothetical protein